MNGFNSGLDLLLANSLLRLACRLMATWAGWIDHNTTTTASLTIVTVWADIAASPILSVSRHGSAAASWKQPAAGSAAGVAGSA